MLVLTRNIGQSIVIGEGENRIKIKLLSQCPETGTFRIGIQAPRQLKILREELLYRGGAGIPREEREVDYYDDDDWPNQLYE